MTDGTHGPTWDAAKKLAPELLRSLALLLPSCLVDPRARRLSAVIVANLCRHLSHGIGRSLAVNSIAASAKAAPLRVR